LVFPAGAPDRAGHDLLVDRGEHVPGAGEETRDRREPCSIVVAPTVASEAVSCRLVSGRAAAP
jgi:hypothetical protein